MSAATVRFWAPVLFEMGRAGPNEFCEFWASKNISVSKMLISISHFICFFRLLWILFRLERFSFKAGDEPMETRASR
jgi:hypothetical protein